MATRSHTFNETSSIPALGGIVCACQLTVMKTYKFDYIRLSPTLGDCSEKCVCLNNVEVKANSEKEAIEKLAIANDCKGFVSSHLSYKII